MIKEYQLSTDEVCSIILEFVKKNEDFGDDLASLQYKEADKMLEDECKVIGL